MAKIKKIKRKNITSLNQPMKQISIRLPEDYIEAMRNIVAAKMADEKRIYKVADLIRESIYEKCIAPNL